MNKLYCYFLLLFSAFTLKAQNLNSSLAPPNVQQICRTAASWQISNHKSVKHHQLDWTNGALYVGMMEWWKVSGDSSAFKFVKDIGENNQWGLLPKVYHADDICVGQAYLELYDFLKKEEIIRQTQERALYIARNPSVAPLKKTDEKGGKERWSWCDALFMAPPVYTSLYRLTGEEVYLTYLENEYKTAVDSLFDTKEHLFYRDNTRISLREKNGAKQFWSRGNGWVFAGLPLIIRDLPENVKSRKYFIKLFRQMAKAVKNTQSKDGAWHSSMLNPEYYQQPENSGSAFFCFGIAWGLRNGLLDRKTYLPVLQKGWASITRFVREDGKLENVQPVGSGPRIFPETSSEVYGVGALLMAGSEIILLNPENKGRDK